MTFSEYLNECIAQIGCNASELARSSGLSQAVISRYRSGDRIPSLGSEQLARIILALSQLSESGNCRPVTEAELRDRFHEILRDEPGSVFLSAQSLNDIIASTDVNIKKLSQAISYDPSYLSRIRSGQRRPSNPITFARGVIRYLLQNCDPKQLRQVTARLSDKSPDLLESEEELVRALEGLLILHWSSLPEGSVFQEESSASALHFVRQVGDFRLEDYIGAIDFDTIQASPSEIHLPTAKTCYGIEEMKQCELEFFRLTILSGSKEAIWMCSDMGMEDMARDLEFGKKWMLALTAAAKKGLRLNILHTLDRPVNEMMLGLESWIPLYMTGQVFSWYLPGSRDKVYSHLHYVSGAAALAGECIRGHHDNCRYYLTRSKKEIAFYRSYSMQLFDCAKPLMTVFTKEDSTRFTSFLASSVSIPGPRRMILSSPPMCSISEDLLHRIIERSGNTVQEEAIMTCRAAEHRHLDIIMKRDRVEIEMCAISREEFDRHPVTLSLSYQFLEHDIHYTWEEYQEHIAQTIALVHEYPLCSISVTQQAGFRNIRIHSLKGHWAMVSRDTSPAIHFVIRHPKLRTALENLHLPVVEDSRLPDES